MLIFEYLLSMPERTLLFSNTGIDRYFCWERREWDTWNKWVDEYLKNANLFDSGARALPRLVTTSVYNVI